MTIFIIQQQTKGSLSREADENAFGKKLKSTACENF